MASSTELSTTSQTRWCRPVGPVEPMYIPGRLRTASSPSRMVMSSSVYDAPASPGLSSTFTATGAPFQNIWSSRCESNPRTVASGLSMRTHHSTRQRLQFGTSERSPATTRCVAQDALDNAPPGGRSTSPPARAAGPESARFHAGAGRPGRVFHRHDEDVSVHPLGSQVPAKLASDQLLPAGEHHLHDGRRRRRSQPAQQARHRLAHRSWAAVAPPALVTGPPGSAQGAAGPPRSPRAAGRPS